MKKMILCLGLILVARGLFAQEKRKEVGVNFSSLNSFGLFYKTGTAKSLWRFNLLNSTSSTFKTEETSEQKYLNTGISIGKEFRTNITPSFEFRYGADIGIGYSNTKNEINENYESTEKRISPNINGVIGVNYVFKKNFAIGIEILPSFTYTKGERTDKQYDIDTDSYTESVRDITTANINLNNNNARISLAYRF